jgi:hypothetical protein
MKSKAMFSVVGVRPDGGPVLIIRQSTLHGAELVKRLVQNASPFSEFRIEYGPDNATPSMKRLGEDETRLGDASL